MLRVGTIVFLFMFSSSAKAQWNYSHRVGSNHGLYSLGPVFKKGHGVYAGSLGVTPNPDTPNNRVFQLNFSSHYNFHPQEMTQSQIGLLMLLSVSNSTFLILPDKYPEDYYPQNALMFAVEYKYVRKNYFVAISVLDYFFEVAARNPPDVWQYMRAASLGFGLDI